MIKKRVTSSDVAAFAGVSRATVSAVLNNSRPVSKELRERVEDAMRKLNYQPNAVARSLKARRTYRIGLLAGSASSPFWARVLKSVEQVVHNKGFNLTWADSNEDPQKELAQLQSMVGQQMEGIILAATGTENQEYIYELNSQIPVVLFDRRLPDIPLDSLACNNELGARLAIEHFISLGYRNIGYTSIALNVGPGYERLKGYKETLRQHNIPINSDWIRVGDYTEESGYHDAMELLSQKNRPDAIFASSHLRAVGVLQAARELGLRVPDDVALIGFDEMPWTAYMDPPLTVVAQPVNEMAKHATELLIRRVNLHWANAQQEDSDENEVVQQVLYRPRLIVRESCGSKLHAPSIEPA